jgi:hypothetical protein
MKKVKILAVSAGIVMLLIMLAAVAFYAAGFRFSPGIDTAMKEVMKHSEIGECIEIAKKCSKVTELTGTPVFEGTPDMIEIKKTASGTKTALEMEVKLSGPKATGTLRVAAVKDDGEWTFHLFEFTDPASGRLPVDIITAMSLKRASE